MKRTLMTAAVLFALLPAACVDEPGGPGAGDVQVLLTDAPFPFESVQRVDVFIEQVDASEQVDTSGAATWTTIARPQQAFNLLDLQRGSTALLGNVTLPAGQYRAVRMTIDPARSRIVLQGGQDAVVHWPVTPGGLIVLHALVEQPLAVGAGAKIIIDFDVGRSFLVLESLPPQFVFIPYIRAFNEAGTGSLSGTVSHNTLRLYNSLANIRVTVLQGDPNQPQYTWWVVSTGRTDGQGGYTVPFLPEGDYIVWFDGQPLDLGCAHYAPVGIQRGRTTTQNVTLSAFPQGCPDEGPGWDPDSTGGDTTAAPGGPVDSVSVRVWLPGGGLSVGDSIPAVAELRNASGAILSGRHVTWSVSDTTLARLEGLFGQYAHLRALAPGSVTLTATSEGKSGSLTLFINSGPTGDSAIATITVTLYPAVPAVGDSGGAFAVLRNASGQQLYARQVTWTVSDSTKVQITGQGVFGHYISFRAVAAGLVTFTARSQGVTGATSVNIGGPVPVTQVVTFGEGSTAGVGDSLLFSAQAYDANGNTVSNRPFTWTVSDTTVFRVTSAAGTAARVRAVGAGVALLTVTCDSASHTDTLTAVAGLGPVATVTIVPSTITAHVHDSILVTATARDAAGTVIPGRTFSWGRQDSTVVLVYPFQIPPPGRAVVIGLKVGTTTFFATTGGRAGQGTVTIQP